jgi:Plants and Prokaryotes Conserved (PCC) domain
MISIAQGRFEILSLSGSFTLSEDGGARSRTGGLSISLAGPDGRVVGGGVAGLLLAASPIQVSIYLFSHIDLVLFSTVQKITRFCKLYYNTNYVKY